MFLDILVREMSEQLLYKNKTFFLSKNVATDGVSNFFHLPQDVLQKMRLTRVFVINEIKKYATTSISTNTIECGIDLD